jgi:hypothetical protein
MLFLKWKQCALKLSIGTSKSQIEKAHVRDNRSNRKPIQLHYCNYVEQDTVALLQPPRVFSLFAELTYLLH